VEGLVIDPAFWGTKRVLVTGHTGFKGSWLSLWLTSLGATVEGFSDGVPTAPSLFADARVKDEVRWLKGDVRQPAEVRAAVVSAHPDIVFHLAAQALVRRSYREPVLTYETNVLGTANVLEACRDRVTTVVVVTSDKCYALGGHVRQHREDDPLGGSDPYSSSKAAAELVTAAYRASFPDELGGIASARSGNVIGGGDWAEDRLVPDLVRGALDQRTVPIRNPGAIRPWQHVLNPLEGYLLLAQRLWTDRSYAEAWNFGPDAKDERPVSSIVGRLSALWDGQLTTLQAEGKQPAEAPVLRLDSSKAAARLGWGPRWGLDEALRQVITWVRSYRDGEDVRELTLQQIRAHQAEAVAA
jgi:CDP-glucose 4,6-dehydratase